MGAIVELAAEGLLVIAGVGYFVMHSRRSMQNFEGVEISHPSLTDSSTSTGDHAPPRSTMRLIW